MTFWDTSALLSLLVGQSSVQQLQSVVSEDSEIIVWWGTHVELASGVCRLYREGRFDNKALSALLTRIDEITSDADEVEPAPQVKTTAVRMLRVHNLRAADALQLAAALVCTDYDPVGVRFVCLDKRLHEAAEREGFAVIPLLS